MGVDQDRAVHLLHLLFSVPASLYSMARHLFDCLGGISDEGLSPVVDIATIAFVVCRAVHAMPRAEQLSHLDIVTLLMWQSMKCKQDEKLLEDVQDLYLWGMTFVTLNNSSVLMGQPDIKIMVMSQTLYPLISGRSPAYEEVLNWVQFTYTWDQIGAYMEHLTIYEDRKSVVDR